MYYDEPAPRRRRYEPLAGTSPAPAAPAVGVRSFPLLGGADERVRRTVAAMSAIASAAIRDPGIVQRAAEMVRDVDGHDARAMIGALRAWLAANVRFVPDPAVDGDVIRTPALLFSQLDKGGPMQGDCDDVATLAATLGQAVGIPARFVTLAFGGPREPFAHVFTELQDQFGQWHEMDVTETSDRRARAQPTRRAVYPAGINRTATIASLLGIVEAAYLLFGVAKGVRGFLREVADDV